MTPDKCFQKVGVVTVALSANSSKTAKGTNFKFDRHVPGIVPTWPLTKVSKTLAWPGSRDHDNTTVPCKLQQWDRYRVPQNVFLSLYISFYLCTWLLHHMLWIMLIEQHNMIIFMLDIGFSLNYMYINLTVLSKHQRTDWQAFTDKCVFNDSF